MTVEDAVTNRLKTKVREETVWSDVVNIVQTLDAGQRQELVDLLKVRNSNGFGRFFVSRLDDYIDDKARTEAQAILADNNIDETEIDRLFND